MADSSGVVPGPQDSLMEEVVEDSTWRLIGMVREGVEDNIMLSRVDIGSWLPLKLLGRCLLDTPPDVGMTDTSLKR